MPGAEATGPAEGDDLVVYGLLRLGGTDVALPLSVLREVVPCPSDLARLPVAAPGLLGAVVVRDTVLPVVDLRPLVGLPGPRQEHQVVVVVAHGGRLVGLLADEVRGVGRVRAGARFAVDAAGTALLSSHAYLDPDGAVVSVLDAEALLRLPGVPTVADTGRSGVDLGAGGRAAQEARTHTVVRIGDRLLALDVAHVHTTLPGEAPRPSVVDGPLCRGTVGFAGHDVVVVDLLALLGLGRAPDGPPGAGLVLDLGVGTVVVGLSALLDLRDLAPSDVLPLPPAAAARPDLLAGLAEVDGHGPCLVLDGAALLRDPDLLSLARARTRSDADDAGRPSPGTVSAVAGPPYLSLSAGVDVVAPLEQVSEIVPVPADVLPAGGGAPGAGAGAVLGVCAHRGAAVPVVSLALLLGQEQGPPTAASCLLLVPVGDGGRLVGLVVDRLHSIDPLRWSDPAQAVADPARPRPAGRPQDALAAAPLVQVGASTRLLPALDLLALARNVDGGPGVLPGPGGPAGAPAGHPAADVPRPRRSEVAVR